MRECYLRSLPSVDLNDVTEQIDCCDYHLSCDEYKKICDEYGLNDNKELLASCNMWVLRSGPSLFYDKKYLGRDERGVAMWEIDGKTFYDEDDVETYGDLEGRVSFEEI